jgi:hypothetical protein
MAGLTDAERRELVSVVARRLGRRGSADTLVTAYLDAMARNAYDRTVQAAPVPTTITAERSAILIEISRGLGRVIEDFEIQALLRVSQPQARAMRNNLIATYSDYADQLTVSWATSDARQAGRVKGSDFTGTVVVFDTEDKRDALVAYARRLGAGVEVLLGEATTPWRALFSDDFPADRLPKKS